MHVLITGAGRGLGFCLTDILLKRGHKVVAGLRKSTKPNALSSLRKRYLERLQIVELDVTNEDSVWESAREVRTRLGHIDVLVNNAAVLLGREATIDDLNVEDLRLSFEVNVFGPIRVVKHYAELLNFGGQAAVINISSEAAFDLSPQDMPYSLSKNALNMFTRKLQAYWKDKEIRVIAVHPGWMRTEMGGSEADLDPYESAAGIADIIENKIAPESTHMVSYLGIPLNEL